VKYLPILISRAQISSYLRSLDFFLHARARGETFGLSLMEAMKCKIPAFSYSGGVYRNHSYILSRSPCSLFKNADELKGKVNQVKYYGDIERNHLLANQFSEEVVSVRLKEILNSLR